MTAAKGSLTVNITVAGGLYQSISGLPENSKGAGDKVANYHYIGLPHDKPTLQKAF